MEFERQDYRIWSSPKRCHFLSTNKVLPNSKLQSCPCCLFPQWFHYCQIGRCFFGRGFWMCCPISVGSIQTWCHSFRSCFLSLECLRFTFSCSQELRGGLRIVGRTRLTFDLGSMTLGSYRASTWFERLCPFDLGRSEAATAQFLVHFCPYYSISFFSFHTILNCDSICCS